MRSNNWFVMHQANPNAKIRLLCFPYAGGGASTYKLWSGFLPEIVEVIAIQPPGRANRMFEPCYTDMNYLIADLLKVIVSVIDRPYIIFGHSLGSRIAFELMVKCKQLGLNLPLHFIASGSRGPHISCSKSAIHHLPDKDFIEELKKLNGTPLEVLEHEELMTLCLPLLRSDFQLAFDYRYYGNLKFDCPVLVLGGKEDTDVTYADLESWGKFFTSSPDIHLLSGDHFFVDKCSDAILDMINIVIMKYLDTRETGNQCT